MAGKGGDVCKCQPWQHACPEQLTSVDLGRFRAFCCACDCLPARGCTSLTHPAAETPNGEENSPTVAPKALQRELNAQCDNGAGQQVSSTSKEGAELLLQRLHQVIPGHTGEVWEETPDLLCSNRAKNSAVMIYELSKAAEYF